ncbi:Leucine-rich repeat protein FLOR 1 [Camellia lanceoleosa]|uniref:Leucine-rich repeat protein FLOR 1 n=1 Tax=Camellia lanceoleosa TaxID=1840588 RepID=A0ACC0GPY3_9ERIC|nr:Leucine-rich repeat protein FLOR 1 [Camellia lanceoleosa]
MNDATHGADNIRNDISALAQRYAVIDCDEDCGAEYILDLQRQLTLLGGEFKKVSNGTLTKEESITSITPTDKIKPDDWKPEETYFYDYIDLSDNEISGSPVGLLNRTNYLVGFQASGNRIRFDMESVKFPNTLKDLDLSRNLVFGKLPKAISGLEKLNVSNNHLCGPIPPNKFPASAFSGNDCLCGSPLSPCKA